MLPVRQLLASVAIALIASVDDARAHSCLISEEKKKIIESVLCGQSAKEVEYQQFGPGCFQRSVEKRLEDSAAQIYMYKMCGDTEFSEAMREGTVRALEFMELLSPCVSETVDIRAVMEDRYRFVEHKAAGLTCNASTRELLTQRRPFFEGMIAQSQDGTIIEKILSGLKIHLDAQGNLVDE